MRLGLISDTHDRLPTMRNALARFQAAGATAVIHAGDLVAPFAAWLLAECPVPVHVVFGNNDGERTGLKSVLPQIQEGPLHLTLDGKRLLVHHFVDWCRPQDVAEADIVITGHTHALHIERREGKLFINPGECCGWVHGRCTAAILDLGTGEVEPIEVSP